jgi:hypothetical protein
MNMAPIELEDGHCVFAGKPGEEHYNRRRSVDQISDQLHE